MKTFVEFNLKRRIFNKMNLMTDFLLFFVILILLNLDFFVSSSTNPNVFYDDSCLPFQQYIEDLTNYKYTIYGIKDDEILVHFDNGFIIVTGDQTEQKVIDDIKDKLRIILKKYYKTNYGYLSDYIEQIDASLYEIETNKKENSSIVSIIGSIVYFMILNYSNIIANELAFEKSTGVSTLVAMNMSSLEHLLSKIVLGYLVPICKVIYLMFIIVIIGGLRYLYDRLEGIYPLIGQLFTDNGNNLVYIDLTKVILIILVLITGLLIIQIIMMILVMNIKNQQNITSFQGLIYVLLLIVYFLFLQYNSYIDFDNMISRVISFLPIVNIVFMSVRIIKNATIVEAILSIAFNIVTLIILIIYSLPMYKEKLTTF